MFKAIHHLWKAIKQLIKQHTRPTTAAIAVGSLSDLKRSRRDLIIENAMLRQQLIVLKTTGEATAAHPSRSGASGLAGQVHRVLAISIAHCAARHPAALAPRPFPQLLAVQIETQAEEASHLARDRQVHQAGGQG